MSYLPGTEEWSKEAIQSRLSFLETCASRAHNLATLLGRNPPQEAGRSSEPVPENFPAIVDSLAEAAELCFSTNDTPNGLLYLARAANIPANDLLIFIQQAVYVGVTEFESIRISMEAIKVHNRIFLFHDAGRAQQLVRSLPILILAALASGPATMYAPILFDFNEAGIPFAVWMAVLASPELATLGLFGLSHAPESFLFRENDEEVDTEIARAGLLEMERNYESRVQLMRNDDYHWRHLRARAELIDWRLLVLHVALIRRERTQAIEGLPPLGPASAFIRSLANEIANSELINA